MNPKKRVRKKLRGVWHQDKRGLWRATFGEHRGRLVSARQKRPGGPLVARIWLNGRYVSQSLKTTDREVAERLVRGLQITLADSREQPMQETATLGRIWRRFHRDCTSWHETTNKHQKDGAARAAILLAHFGDGFDASELSRDDLEKYVDARTKGRVVLSGGLLRPASKYSAQADVHFLNRMLNWATTVRTGKHSFWLARNPTGKFHVKSEQQPRRPYSDPQRVVATFKAIDELFLEDWKLEARRREDETGLSRRDGRRKRTGQAAAPPRWARWAILRLALVIADGYGRRLGSIRQLHWNDADFENKTIRWRAEADKKRKETVLPLLPHVAEAFREYRRLLPGVGDAWVFPAQKNPAMPSDRHTFDDWLRRAEKRARLPKLAHGSWHPIRRMWAMQRKKLPISDVMEVGGWSDHETLLRCYQQPDKETMLEVLEAPRKARQAAGD